MPKTDSNSRVSTGQRYSIHPVEEASTHQTICGMGKTQMRLLLVMSTPFLLLRLLPVS